MAKKIKAFLGKLWDEFAPAVSHGASELGASLYTGSGYVMYSRSGPEPVTMASLRAEAHSKEQGKDTRGQERGGPERSGPEL